MQTSGPKAPLMLKSFYVSKTKIDDFCDETYSSNYISKGSFQPFIEEVDSEGSTTNTSICSESEEKQSSNVTKVSEGPNRSLNLKQAADSAVLNHNFEPCTPKIAPQMAGSTENGASKADSRKVFAKYWSTDGVFYYCMSINNVLVCRRSNDSFINGTKLLNAAGLTRGRRDGLLKKAEEKFIIRTGVAPLRGVWIPLALAQKYVKIANIEDLAYPLLEDDLELAFKNNPQFVSAVNKKLRSYKLANKNKPQSPVNKLNTLMPRKPALMPSPGNEAFNTETSTGEHLENINSFKRHIQPTPKELHPKPYFTGNTNLPPVEVEKIINSYGLAAFYQPKHVDYQSLYYPPTNDYEKKNINNFNHSGEKVPKMHTSISNDHYHADSKPISVQDTIPVPLFPNPLAWHYRQIPYPNFLHDPNQFGIFSYPENISQLSFPSLQQQFSRVFPPDDHTMAIRPSAYQNYTFFSQKHPTQQ